MLTETVESLLNDLSNNKNKKESEKMRFFVRQMLDAMSPTNFPQINPEILAKTAKTNGKNILNGFQQFLRDIEKGKGYLDISLTNNNFFKLGENIATTEGKIIYQNDLMQLIQYSPTTTKLYPHPLLIIPPWINKYYILDLQPENSLVKWLVNQGFNVFMISWVNPNTSHRNKQFVDYMTEGPLSALKVIQAISPKSVNVLGYCIGGTLLGCTLAYLAKHQKNNIQSATFVTSLLDFSVPGELGVFIDEKQISFLEEYMAAKGYLDGRVLASVFNALRANDLIWNSFINNYLKGEAPKPFDLLYWNTDPTNLPEKMHSFYLRNMYLNNLLIKKNKLKLLDTLIDLTEINLPTYFLAAKEDHIVPWIACFKGSQYLKGKTKFVLTSSGHVAGVVNHPAKNKYGYWINTNKRKTPESFLADASYYKGSWWIDWVSWLKQYSGKPISKKPSQQTTFLEDAPGSYVKVRLTGST